MKHIIIISITFILTIYNVSCMKNGSSTSYIANSLDGSLYYYKLCHVDHDDAICKFSCTDNNTTSITYDNINNVCNKPVVFVYTSSVGMFSDKIQENILMPILAATRLQILEDNSEDFKNFDDFMMDHGANGGDTICQSNCSSTGLDYKPWIITIEGSEIIYKNATKESDIIKLRWSGLMKNSKQEYEMTYEEAKEACENYNFKYSDWSLPPQKFLQRILEKDYEFGSILKLGSQSAIWSLENVAVNSRSGNPLTTQTAYTICVHTYELGD